MAAQKGTKSSKINTNLKQQTESKKYDRKKSFSTPSNHSCTGKQGLPHETLILPRKKGNLWAQFIPRHHTNIPRDIFRRKSIQKRKLGFIHARSKSTYRKPAQRPLSPPVCSIVVSDRQMGCVRYLGRSGRVGPIGGDLIGRNLLDASGRVARAVR